MPGYITTCVLLELDSLSYLTVPISTGLRTLLSGQTTQIYGYSCRFARAFIAQSSIWCSSGTLAVPPRLALLMYAAVPNWLTWRGGSTLGREWSWLTRAVQALPV